MQAVQDKPTVPQYIAIGSISAAVLCFEILLLRLFAFSHWHHFAGLAVSLALLGFGAAGTTLVLLGDWIKTRADTWFNACLLLCATSFLVVLLLHSQVSLRPLFAAWDQRELAKLLLVDVAAFLPFYFAGLAIGQVFQRWPESTRTLYSWNLLGSGIGSVVAGLLLMVTQVETIISLLAVLVFLLVAVLNIKRIKRVQIRILFLSVGALIPAMVLFINPPMPAVSDFKALAKILDLPDAEVIATRPGLEGRLALVRSSSLRFAPGLSLEWTETVPAVDVVIIGSDRVVPLAPIVSANAAAHAQASLTGLPLLLRPQGKVLQLGSGAWQTQSMVTARHELTWVESDARILDIAAARGAERFSLLADTTWRQASVSSETFALVVLDKTYTAGDAAAADYLLTVQGITALLQRLEPDGLLAIPWRLNYPPRHYQRLIATVNEALQPGDPQQRVAVIRGLQSLLVLISPSEIKKTDSDFLRDFSTRWGFDLVWLPGMTRMETNRVHRLATPVFHDTTAAIFSGQELPQAASWFTDTTATLNTPYLWRSINWQRVQELFAAAGRQAFIYLDWTLVLAVVSTLLVSVLAFLFILAPLGKLPVATNPFSRLTVAGYFLALGLGYMLVEMAIFQRLVLFIGEPVLTASIVFATFLVGSGIGSATAPEVRDRRAVLPVFLYIGLGMLLVGGVIGLATEFLLQPSLVTRIVLLVLLLLPLAWAMGRPFPWGLRQLSSMNAWIPWAWGINGFASVAAASTATLLSVHFSQLTTLATGLVCYGVALGIANLWTR